MGGKPESSNVFIATPRFNNNFITSVIWISVNDDWMMECNKLLDFDNFDQVYYQNDAF